MSAYLETSTGLLQKLEDISATSSASPTSGASLNSTPACQGGWAWLRAPQAKLEADCCVCASSEAFGHGMAAALLLSASRMSSGIAASCVH